MNIFIINAGQSFAHSFGKYNHSVTEWTTSFFQNKDNCEIKVTNIVDGYDIEEEISKFIWADRIIYHTPIWWFQLPYTFKKYLDEVLTAGHNKGLYVSDGRHAVNPKRNYGKGGSMHGKDYMLTTTWNAPVEAFELEDEFFNQTSVDDGAMYGFHKMNQFLGLTQLKSFHFHDVSKDPQIEKYKELYLQHLEKEL